MSGFRATNDAGERVDDLSPAELDQLLGAWSDLTIVNPDWGDRQWVEARREADGLGWRVRVRSGDRTLLGRAPGRAATYDLLRSWAAADGWWQEAFTWRTD